MNDQCTLNELHPGEACLIKGLSCSGSIRRRLLDLGLVEDTVAVCVGQSPHRNPKAYLIRGATIALRDEDSRQILVERTESPFKPDKKTIAIAGNPNVGKSTVFNHLANGKQHTGNWTGKTVASAKGLCCTEKHCYEFVDIPGTYSLMAHSAEEEVARNFLCFEHPDAIIIVCDATCLERNLNLVLQTLEITSKAVLCVNLMDEACCKQIALNLDTLSQTLGIPAVGTSARKKDGLKELLNVLDTVIESPSSQPLHITYPEHIRKAVSMAEPAVSRYCTPALEKAGCHLPSQWLTLRLLDNDTLLIRELENRLGHEILARPELIHALDEAHSLLAESDCTGDTLTDQVVTAISHTATDISAQTVTLGKKNYLEKDMKRDRILTSRRTGYPVMLLLLAVIFWITLVGANYPSAWLSDFFAMAGDKLSSLMLQAGTSLWLHDILISGVYRVTTWVIAVMLPPMAIFFPLFTFLEDVGYLPRIAYNLDHHFQKCRACGKQSLCMCLGFGCNAAGVVGCRIIDSPRERLIAILTNCFVPCNGRLPTLIVLISMFFTAFAGGFVSSLLSAVILTCFILLGIAMTFLVSRVLSCTILKGIPSSFTLELPPYRRPQAVRIILHSLRDRTVFVLGRAVAAAVPAGLILYAMANLYWGELSLLNHFAGLLQPLGRIMGLDGMILVGFILGFPANEIVLPVIVMGYLAQGSLGGLPDQEALFSILTLNGWTWKTAVCTCLFSLMHWPCSTTLMTIRKETGSLWWTFLAFVIPTLAGCGICILVSLALHALPF